MSQKKTRLIAKIVCIVLAGLMVLSVGTYIFYAISGLL